MIGKTEIYNIYDAVLNGQISKEEAGNWAYDVINSSEGLADQKVENALYNLVSFHDIGMIFGEFRPDDGKLVEIRDSLG